jgi:LytS/YehU family sensor histidine kinase
LQKTQLENEQFKQAHLRAQLIALQQQLSPHFLFNSLSTLKTIAHDSETKKFVLQLSHVYRYMLNINEKQVTSVSDELSFLNSYLYILNQRFESSLRVFIHIPNEFMEYLIPPLSLQLLVENAIKHNALSPEQPLEIRIEVSAGQEIVVTNNYRPKKVPVDSTGMGLQNINDRFKLLFNKPVEVNKTDKAFTVKIPLIVYEGHYH